MIGKIGKNYDRKEQREALTPPPRIIQIGANTVSQQ